MFWLTLSRYYSQRLQIDTLCKKETCDFSNSERAEYGALFLRTSILIDFISPGDSKRHHWKCARLWTSFQGNREFWSWLVVVRSRRKAWPYWFERNGQVWTLILKLHILLTGLSTARTDEGFAIDFRYVGVIKMTDVVNKIFDMDPEMATVPFGFASKLEFSLQNSG